jgi:hypothetical protein
LGDESLAKIAKTAKKKENFLFGFFLGDLGDLGERFLETNSLSFLRLRV